MVNFMFWNVARKGPLDEISLLCREHDVDLLILAEYRSSTVPLVLALNEGRAHRVYIAPFDPSPQLTF
jgi:hypothetical protein